MKDKLKIGGYSDNMQHTSGFKIRASRYSDWGTPEEWEQASQRFWFGKIKPEMREIRSISHLNPYANEAFKSFGRPRKIS